MGAERLAEVRLDRLQRVEPGHRLLEDQAELGPAQLPHLLHGQPDELASAVADRAGDRRRVGKQAEHAAAERRLAAARLADQPECLAGADREADAVDGANGVSPGPVPDPEVADVEDRLAAASLLVVAGRAHGPLGSLSPRGGSIDRIAASPSPPGCSSISGLAVLRARISGLMTSLSPSPNSVKPVTSSTIASPG